MKINLLIHSGDKIIKLHMFNSQLLMICWRSVTFSPPVSMKMVKLLQPPLNHVSTSIQLKTRIKCCGVCKVVVWLLQKQIDGYCFLTRYRWCINGIHAALLSFVFPGYFWNPNWMKNGEWSTAWLKSLRRTFIVTLRLCAAGQTSL